MLGWFSRTNSLVLVLLGVMGLVASFAVRDLVTAAVVLGCYLISAVLFLPLRSGPPARYLAVALGAGSIGYSTWLVGDHDLGTAVVAALRLAVLALPGVALAPLIVPAELTDQLGQRLRLPARFVVALGAALQRMDQLGDTWQQLARARRARGLGPGRGPISRSRWAGSMTFGLLVATLRQSAAMAVAMDARGFADAHQRTWAVPARWNRLDSALTLLGCGVVVLAHAVNVMW